jgi:type IV pilus assembly protein PilA
MPLHAPLQAQTRQTPFKCQQGFTLVELMIVVVIVGVLGALGTYGVRKYINNAAASEVTSVVATIRGAQEVYRQDTFKYFDVSEGDFNKTNPDGPPSNKKKAWASNSVTAKRFKELGVQLDGAVSFTYAVVAGVSGAAFPTLPTQKTTSDFKFPATAQEPFYIIVGKSDLNGDSKFGYVVSHSLVNDSYVENEGF